MRDRKRGAPHAGDDVNLSDPIPADLAAEEENHSRVAAGGEAQGFPEVSVCPQFVGWGLCLDGCSSPRRQVVIDDSIGASAHAVCQRAGREHYGRQREREQLHLTIAA